MPGVLVIQRVPQPAPSQIRLAREKVGLSQTAALQLVSDAGVKGYRTWQRYEAPVGSPDHRTIPIGIWELFLLRTGQHPTHKLVQKLKQHTEGLCT
jgi:hypothetical protein